MIFNRSLFSDKEPSLTGSGLLGAGLDRSMWSVPRNLSRQAYSAFIVRLCCSLLRERPLLLLFSWPATSSLRQWNVSNLFWFHLTIVLLRPLKIVREDDQSTWPKLRAVISFYKVYFLPTLTPRAPPPSSRVEWKSWRKGRSLLIKIKKSRGEI